MLTRKKSAFAIKNKKTEIQEKREKGKVENWKDESGWKARTSQACCFASGASIRGAPISSTNSSRTCQAKNCWNRQVFSAQGKTWWENRRSSTNSSIYGQGLCCFYFKYFQRIWKLTNEAGLIPKSPKYRLLLFRKKMNSCRLSDL